MIRRCLSARAAAGFLVGALCLAGGAPMGATTEAPPVAVAANLRFAMPELIEAFRETHGASVRPSYGSSGNLRRQITQNAPYELFLSADEGYVQALDEGDHTRDAGKRYARGRIAIVVGDEAPAGLTDGSLEALRERLRSGELGRFAIANPDHAPYGRAARQALENAGLWQAIQSHLLVGENVAQASRFALSGEADGGIVALSLATADTVAKRSRFDPIPADAHEPLHQRMVLLTGASDTAEAFYAFMTSERARAILSEHGFSPAGTDD